MIDIEDYLIKKNNTLSQFNNINYSSENIQKLTILVNNLLQWINNNYYSINDDKYYENFEIYLNKQFRLSRIKNIRKTIIINLLNVVKIDDIYIKHLDTLKLCLRKRRVRNISGVCVITVLTSPYPNGQSFSCKHDCFYCPNEPAHSNNNWQAQPRSYLYHEPAVLRANRWGFEPIQQMFDRMDSYIATSNVVDKIEIIIEGGTYCDYPVDYLEKYHRDLFYAANIYFDVKKALIDSYTNITEISKSIRQPLTIQQEMQINKTALIHIIGLSIECRPDSLNNDWLHRFRNWGVTKIQIGIQHTDNAILYKINRGHTIEQALWAIQYLKDNCFKVHIHIMPDLPGTSSDIDMKMFDFVYSNVCPDEMKIYPCQIVPWTKIKQWYDKGIYKPYFDDNPQYLIDVIKYAMETCPNYIRVPRCIRDIPVTQYVTGGNNISNMRQIVDNLLNGDYVKSKEIRSREIGRNIKYYNLPANYNIYKYKANNGTDYFIAYESYDKVALFGFIRLRIVQKNNLQIFKILNHCGLIRELHVYGDVTQVNTIKKQAVQHTGIGTGLLKIAERITMENGLNKVVVISGEGVKGYYEKKGYIEKNTFMIKKLSYFIMIYYYLINIIYFYFNLT